DTQRASGGSRGQGERRKWRQRQAKIKSRSLPGDASALYPDMALHRLGQLTAEKEPQPIADDRGGQVAWQADKALEEQRNLVGWDPQAIVTHSDLDHAPLAPRTQSPTARSLRLRRNARGDLDRRPRLRVLERVREQVSEDLLHPYTLAPDR